MARAIPSLMIAIGDGLPCSGKSDLICQSSRQFLLSNEQMKPDWKQHVSDEFVFEWKQAVRQT
jgi:hypothetical protein